MTLLHVRSSVTTSILAYGAKVKRTAIEKQAGYLRMKRGLAVWNARVMYVIT